MPNFVECPSCGRKLHLKEETIGQEVQCPSCMKTFVAEEPIILLAPNSASDLGPLRPQEDGDEPPPGIPGLPPPPRPFKPVLLSSSTGESWPSSISREPEMMRCPMCKRLIPEDVFRCPVCKTDLQDEVGEDAGPPRRDYEPHRAGLIATLGTISIILAVPGLCGALHWVFAISSLIATCMGVSAWVMAHDDLEQMSKNVMDPEGRDRTVTGQNNGTIGAVVGGIGLVLGGIRLLIYFGYSI